MYVMVLRHIRIALGSSGVKEPTVLGALLSYYCGQHDLGA
jgi:hypothetical protein